MALELEQHNREIQANVENWRRKPVLQEVYRDFYAEISGELWRDAPGETVEIGSGIGSLKTVMPEALATDLFPNPWLDRVENAYALGFADESVANLILFDVWHHLEYPGTALAEFHRVLAKGGRLIIFDPAMGVLGRIVYGIFHREPLGLRERIKWSAPVGFSPDKMGYYAAQANAHRVFLSGNFTTQLADWRVVRRSLMAALPYVASGGFSGPQLYPKSLLPLLRLIDRVASRCPGIFATRLLVVLERK
jgi:SAM-dependent methyltransferase